jgi:hypothetical protein
MSNEPVIRRDKVRAAGWVVAFTAVFFVATVMGIGMGEGSFIPLAVSGSPLTPWTLDNLFSAPIVSQTFGALIVVGLRRLCLVLLVVHYACIPFAIPLLRHSYSREFHDFIYKAPVGVAAWLVCYVWGNRVVWRFILGREDVQSSLLTTP